MGVRGLRGEERRVEIGRWDKVAMSEEDKTTKQVEIGRKGGTNDLSDKRGGSSDFDLGVDHLKGLGMREREYQEMLGVRKERGRNKQRR